MSTPQPWSGFNALVAGIGQLDRASVLAVGRQSQQILSLRNWLIGTWIVQYEQDGADRAAYGTGLLSNISLKLKAGGSKGLSARNLRNYRQVAKEYPSLNPQELAANALASASDSTIWQAPAKFNEPTSELPWRDTNWVHRLFRELTFTHLVEFARMDDTTERAFYELHCLKEGWTTRELIRQKNTMLYQRVGLSTDRDAVLALAQQGVVDERPRALLRDPYVLEFLGLPGTNVDEATLEQALLDNLQSFLAELGHEFCFVARQFRITLGNRHFHLDLLFFHRRLRCLIAIDLKTTDFVPDHAGQMRFYLNYLAKEVAMPDENPPMGILLCAGKDEEIVEFAAAVDDAVLVSRYLLELPKKEQLQQWLHEARAVTETHIRQQTEN